MKSEPQAEHHWLHKLIGEWTSEMEAVMGPGKAPEKFRGKERVRSFGGLWTLGEGEGDMPGGGKATTLMTLGYDPSAKRYVGTFIASMMNYLWVYDGQLDPGGRILRLRAEGPGMSGDGKMAKHEDMIEFISDDHRTLSRVLGEDGQWGKPFMTAHYRRVK